MQDLCLCTCLISFSKTSSRFIHTIAYCRTSFFYEEWIIFYFKCMCLTIIAHLGSFWIWATVNNALVGSECYLFEIPIIILLDIWGGTQILSLFIKNCVFILTCLNFSDFQSTLHLMQYTYQDFFFTAQNSFLTYFDVF